MENVADKKDYELGLILPSEKSLDEVVSLLTKSGAGIKSQERPRKVKLAYEIKKYREAYFGVVIFSILPELLPSIDESLKFSPEVIRFIRVKPVKVKESRNKDKADSPNPSPSPAPSSEVISPSPAPTPETTDKDSLTNEALEKKLEEILR